MASLLLFMSCTSSQNISGGEAIKNAIKGTWTIKYETCCGRNAVTTYGGNKTITFNIKKGTYKIADTSTATERGNFTMDTENEMGTMIKIGDKFPAIIRIQDGELIIDRGYMDLNKEVYTR